MSSEESPGPSDSTPGIVIIGASLGGATAALALRERGYDDPITLIGDEPHPPYERPPLSKALLLGDTDEPDWVATAEDYEAKGISLVTARATAIDRTARTVTAGTETYPYDRLLLATGSSARRLDLPGSSRPGVLTLRTLDEAVLLRDLLTEGRKIVVVGSGWIGSEIAAAAASRGATVTLLDQLEHPLLRVLGPEVGAVFGALHAEHGVDVRGGVEVVEFVGETGLTGVRLSDGSTIETDLAVVGAGAVPNVDLAADAGLVLDGGGVAVDATLQTSDPSIWAVGDIAAHDHPFYGHRVRVEHWDNAKSQGEHVAVTMLGSADPYTKLPFFFSDQYDLGCEYRGLADPEHDQLVVRGSLADRDFTAFWLRGGAVRAALNVNQWDDGDALQDLVSGARTATVDELQNGPLSA